MIQPKKTKLSIKNNLFLFIDAETTGFPIKINNKYPHYTNNSNYDNARIIQLSWMVYDYKQHKITDKSFLIKPNGFSIDNAHIHGITTEFVNDNGTDISQVLSIFIKDLKRVKFLIAHALDFYKNILYNELYRANKQHIILTFDKMEHVCTSIHSRNTLKLPSNNTFIKYKTPSLAELYKFCFDKELEYHYNSKYDVQCVADCFFYLLHLNN